MDQRNKNISCDYCDWNAQPRSSKYHTLLRGSSTSHLVSKWFITFHNRIYNPVVIYIYSIYIYVFWGNPTIKQGLAMTKKAYEPHYKDWIHTHLGADVLVLPDHFRLRVTGFPCWGNHHMGVPQ
jgi:hypothetical protein